jgi:hypothetical protein
MEKYFDWKPQGRLAGTQHVKKKIIGLENKKKTFFSVLCCFLDIKPYCFIT